MNDFEPKDINDLPKDDPLLGALNDWADGAEDYKPFDASALPVPKRPRSWTGWRAAATLAAAAMFVFALSQTSFTLSLGDATLEWGETTQADANDLSTYLAETQARSASIEQALAAHAEAINAIAIDSALLAESLKATAIELAQRQELESAARVYDMQHLAKLVSYQP